MATAALHKKAEATLLAKALGYPDATEHHPWGETAIKVKGKVFLFMGGGDGEWGISVKLPLSGGVALTLPFAEPTGYGLGKSGWVSARFKAKDKPPVEMLVEWLDESYRAIAPKKSVAALDGGDIKTAPKRAPKKRRS
jgi:predicted DNA-binding protein (MmcQ/YjbR family)